MYVLTSSNFDKYNIVFIIIIIIKSSNLDKRI